MKKWNQSAVARATRVLTGAAAAAVCSLQHHHACPPRWQGETPASMLWVGNSFFYFNNSMHGHLGGLLNAANVRGIRQTSVSISGAGLDWHDMASHFKPGTGMLRYSFTPTNDVSFNTVRARLRLGADDGLQPVPDPPQAAAGLSRHGQSHAAAVRRAGAEPALFLSWAYQDQPQMTDQLAAEYIKAGRANNMRVVPAGPAFAASIAKRPDINLYAPDKRHPSLAGTYLGAAVVMASVFKKSPVGNTYTAGLPADVAQHLQAVAWETVQSFKQ